MSTFDKSALNAMTATELLNININEVDLIKPYEPYPTAVYEVEIVGCGLESVGKDESPAIELQMKLLSVIEFADAADGDAFDHSRLPTEYTENFFLNSKDGYGVRAFLTAFKNYAFANNLDTPQQIMEQLAQGSRGSLLIVKRTWKDKETGEMRTANRIDLEQGYVMA